MSPDPLKYAPAQLKDLDDVLRAGCSTSSGERRAKRGLAIAATPQAMNELKSREAAAAHRLAEEKKAAEAAAKELEGKTVKLYARGGAGGKLFGSVSTKEIAEAIQKELGIELDKRKISLDAEIKAFGTYNAEVKLYAGVSARVFVVVSEQQ